MRQVEDIIRNGASAKCCFIKVGFDTFVFMLCVEHIQRLGLLVLSPVKAVMVKNIEVLI